MIFPYFPRKMDGVSEIVERLQNNTSIPKCQYLKPSIFQNPEISELYTLRQRRSFFIGF